MTFAGATHAAIVDVPLNADYPLMMPRVISCDGGKVTLAGRGKTVTVSIIKKGRFEACIIEQCGAYEALFGAKPARCLFFPFKESSR